MEVENAKSDLLSLRKLYGLLRRSADDVRTARNGFVSSLIECFSIFSSYSCYLLWLKYNWLFYCI